MLSQLLFSIFVTLFLYILPGYAILDCWALTRGLSVGEKIGLSAGLSLSLYPLCALWSYVLGIDPGALLAWLPGTLAILVLLWRNRARLGISLLPRAIHRSVNLPLYDYAWIVLALVIGYIRLLPIQQMVTPAWGDSVHHTTIVQLILDHGGLFQSWAPYAPMRSFTYHFGYHVAIACWSWVSGMSAIQSVIVGGQMINMLAICALYPITVRLAQGNHYAGIGAMLVAGFFTEMPAYYVNWGRYTQLTAQVILPVFVWFLNEFLLKKTEKRWHYLIAIMILSVGLTLTHYRVAVVATTAVLAWGLWGTWEYRHHLLAWSRCLRQLAGVGVGSLLLILPWLYIIRSGRLLVVTGAISSRAADSDVNLGELNVWQSLDIYYPHLLWQVAILIVLITLWKRPDFFVKFGFWCGFSFLAASPFMLGLPGTGLITNFLLIVGAYIVIAITCGLFLGWLSTKLLTLRWGNLLYGLLLMVVLAVGSQSQRQIVDPLYQLVTANDVKAFAWTRENVPANARFLVNGFLAYGDKLVVGSDAGWWLPFFTQREATVPPILYTTEALSSVTDRTFFRQFMISVRESQGKQVQLRQTLCQSEITNIFLGQKQGEVGVNSGSLVPSTWLQMNSDFRLLHQDGDAQVWEFDRSKCHRSAKDDG